MAAARALRATKVAEPSAPAPTPGIWAPPAILSKLEKLGIRSRFDLVLHLPMRYEDETRLTPLCDARPGEPVLVEAEVVEAEVKYRGRRTLVVKLTDGEAELWIRFLNFYPSQVKQMEPGRRLRLFGEVKPGFFGAEMVHPKYRVVTKDMPLSTALTPVYPTTAGISQSQLRALIERALDTLLMEDTLDAALLRKLELAPFRESVLLLHRPPPDVAARALEEARRASPRTGDASPSRGARADCSGRASRGRWRSARTRRGAGSSSTRSWRSNSPCASPTANGARKPRPRCPRNTPSPTRS